MNNAGFGVVSELEKTDVARILEMVQVNVTALTELTLRVLPEMLRARPRRNHQCRLGRRLPAGRIYGGLCGDEGLCIALQRSPVGRSARTRGHRDHFVSGNDPHRFFQRFGVPNWLEKHSAQDVKPVVRTALKALEKGQFVCRFRLEELHPVAAGANRHASHCRQRIDEVLPAEDVDSAM